MSRGRRAALGALLMLTGAATFANVFRLTIWAVWGRPAHPTEILSLLGSLVLIVLGFVAFAAPRFASRFALLALAANWSFFGYAIPTLVEQQLVTQAIDVTFVRWSPGPGQLTLITLPSSERAASVGTRTFQSPAVTDADLGALSAAGLTGTVAVSGHAELGQGDPARILVVLSRQLIQSPIDLIQPAKSNAIYVQDGADFHRTPSDVALSRLSIRLEIANHTNLQTWFSVEMADGSRVGGTAYIWPKPAS